MLMVKVMHLLTSELRLLVVSDQQSTTTNYMNKYDLQNVCKYCFAREVCESI